ncbi:hypothetical protein [Polymorphospora rubra]|uniref:Lipoprotein n=1 Tax=Polymorphospora rubra TaxID=338584 RepID=A0A810N0T8_9ACTN|nr:hypothetical protein [Polymorphospora rubra]BCJ67022.1 hypothetical protein Prubr_40430 [Polymorphospora rubra]
MRAPARGVVPLILALLTACSGGTTASVPPRIADRFWPAPVASVQLERGSTALLHVASGTEGADAADPKAASSRCWRVAESRNDAETAAVSACHGQDAIAASRALGVVVVVSACAAPTSVRLESVAGNPTINEVFDGVFLVPPSMVGDDATTISFSCVDDAGPVSEAVTLEIAR